MGHMKKYQSCQVIECKMSKNAQYTSNNIVNDAHVHLQGILQHLDSKLVVKNGMYEEMSVISDNQMPISKIIDNCDCEDCKVKFCVIFN